MADIKILLAGPGTGKTTKIKEIIKEHKNPSKILVLSFTNGTINDLLSTFRESDIEINEKNCMTLHKYAMKINHLQKVQILTQAEKHIMEKYAEWCNMELNTLCKLLNCMSFEQMISECAQFISTNSEYAKQKIGEIELLVVDEYQDFNEKERSLINAISEYSKEMIILGDDDQCIYGFKNADSDGIISLYENTEVIRLEHENICYRCPDEVVDGATNLIVNNKKRVDKKWQKKGNEGKLHIVQHGNQDQSAQYILNEIQKALVDNPKTTTMILSPNRHITSEITAKLTAEKVELVDLISRGSQNEILTKIFYLRTIFGDKKLINILFLLYPRIKGDKRRRDKILEKVKESLEKDVNNPEIIEFLLSQNILPETMTKFIRKEPNPDDFFKECEDFKDFKEFFIDDASRDLALQKVDQFLMQKLEHDFSKPNIMTIHSSKGLQADLVFIVGLVDGIFPRESTGTDTIEAERRLLYVGMTRAKQTLHLISTIEWSPQIAHKFDNNKFRFKGRDIRTAKASPFISEIKHLN